MASWLDEIPLGPVGARPTAAHVMAMRSLPAGAWLAHHEGDDALLRLKVDVLRDHHDDVVARAAGCDRALRLAFEAVAAATRRPVSTLESLALATAEDVCVLVSTDGRWVLVGGAVCFPSMWRLPDKLGLTIARVHDPVPRYVDELEDRVDRFLDRLRVGAPAWRRNWFIHDVDDLFLPAPRIAPAPTSAVAAEWRSRVPDGLWLRSERQSLAKIADDVVVFTIRTQQVPLSAVGARPDIAEAMLGAVRSWSDEIVAYRGAAAWRADVIRWLAAVSDTA